MKRCLSFGVVFSSVLVAASSSLANKDAKDWTPQEVRRVLSDSPWAQSASAVFENDQEDIREPVGPLPGAAQAGMAGSRGTSDTRWDGGVGRNVSTSLPKLNVLVRWDSALPVREALSRSGINVLADPKSYVVTIEGLVPAGRYRQGRLQTKSESGNLDPSGVETGDAERILENLMGASKLVVRGRPLIVSDDVKLDSTTGDLHIFFPRSAVISLRDKEVIFSARFGSLTVVKKFRLRDMVYKGQLEL